MEENQDSIENQVKKLIETKGKLAAVQHVKDSLKISLKEAKELVDEVGKKNPGLKPAKATKSGIIAAIIVFIVVIGGCRACFSGSSSSSSGKADTHEQRIQKLFSAWDGSVPSVEKWIKANIKDPDSYKHIETKYWDQGAKIVIKTKFTATNSFGGRISSLVRAEIDTTGRLIEANFEQ